MEKPLFGWYEFNKFNKLVLASVLLTLFSFAFVDFSWLGICITLLMYTITGGFGISITFHRCISHSSFKMHPIVLALGKFFGAMGGTGSPIMWVQIHRTHHLHSDREGDPHSPLKSIRTLVGSFPEVTKRGLRKFAGDIVSIFLHRYYFKVLYAYALVWLCFGVDMFFYGFLYPAIMVTLISNLLNVMAHTHIISYKSFSTLDNSVNTPIMSLIAFGEGWHNNHHRYPNNANFQQKWWEYDIGYGIIRLLSFFRLATIKTNGYTKT